MLEQLVLEWATSDPDALLNHLDVIPQNKPTLGQSQAAVELARIAPEKVASMVHEVLDEEFKLDLALELVSSWAERVWTQLWNGPILTNSTTKPFG